MFNFLGEKMMFNFKTYYINKLDETILRVETLDKIRSGKISKITHICKKERFFINKKFSNVSLEFINSILALLPDDINREDYGNSDDKLKYLVQRYSLINMVMKIINKSHFDKALSLISKGNKSTEEKVVDTSKCVLGVFITVVEPFFRNILKKGLLDEMKSCGLDKGIITDWNSLEYLLVLLSSLGALNYSKKLWLCYIQYKLLELESQLLESGMGLYSLEKMESELSDTEQIILSYVLGMCVARGYFAHRFIKSNVVIN
jgi:hypothetical protein